jgi:phosphate starvation-inducible PhoH-like protein|tara:strand:+ start:4166 stop:5290 length:1125 start_codon:yes stop_codon:yes gene_type:complete
LQNTSDATATLAKKISLEPNDPRRLAALVGPVDQNIKHLEKRLGVSIRSRGNEFQLSGIPNAVQAAEALLHQLYRETVDKDAIEPDFVHLFLQQAGLDDLVARTESADEQGPPVVMMSDADRSAEANSEASADASAGSGELVIRTPKKSIKPRGGNQLSYCRAIRKNDINFGIGPAGTGKTYLAVACAVEALESQQVSRILLVRPAVEAGEKLGFLPGDLAQKIDPYLRPLYDALYEMLGVERVNKYIERNIIEVAPLAYMRGRTLNNAFIILDESQNTTVAQMKMFLTRIGFGSTAVVTGDITQIDLPRGEYSGLINVRDVLARIAGIEFTHFGSKDVVRHPLVQKIVDAYESFQGDSQTQRGGDRRGSGRGQ